MKSLSPLLSLLLLPLAGCTVGTSGGIETTSVECVDDGGEIVCSEHEGEDAPDSGGDVVCSDTGCVTTCEAGDGASHCVTECENGMRCEQSCEGEACSMSCTCPGEDGDGGGDGDGDGGGDGDYCAEHPDDLECFCKEHPDSAECQDGGGDGGGDCPDGDLECFCKENPEHAECQAG